MKPNVRACVAYTAGRLISKKTSSSIYDYSQSKHISIDGEIQPNNVDISCHFGGV